MCVVLAVGNLTIGPLHAISMVDIFREELGTMRKLALLVLVLPITGGTGLLQAQQARSTVDAIKDAGSTLSAANRETNEVVGEAESALPAPGGTDAATGPASPGSQAGGSIDALIEQLDAADAEVRIAAAQALGARGALAAAAAPALERCLQDRNRDVARAAATALAAIGEPALNEMRSGLFNRDAEVRKVSAAGIAALADKAYPAIDDLASCLGDPDPAVQDAVGAAMVAIGTKALPKLRELITSPNAAVQKAAMEAVSAIGPETALAEQAETQEKAGDAAEEARAAETTLQGQSATGLGSPPDKLIAWAGLEFDPEDGAAKELRHRMYGSRPDALNNLQAWNDWQRDSDRRQWAFQNDAATKPAHVERLETNESAWGAAADEKRKAWAELDAEQRRDYAEHELVNEAKWEREWEGRVCADPSP